MTFYELQKKARLRLLKMHFHSGVGHIGGNLSALDALLYLHHFILKKNDQFILSKGHAAGALYIALWSIGKISDAQLSTFHQDQTKLAGHPAPNWLDEIPFATGSLGHGLGLACSLALGNKLQNRDGRIFCLMSDGEWQEGSNWESLIFLNHQQLEKLTVIVDYHFFRLAQSFRRQHFGRIYRDHHQDWFLEPVFKFKLAEDLLALI